MIKNGRVPRRYNYSRTFERKGEGFNGTVKTSSRIYTKTRKDTKQQVSFSVMLDL